MHGIRIRQLNQLLLRWFGAPMRHLRKRFKSSVQAEAEYDDGVFVDLGNWLESVAVGIGEFHEFRCSATPEQKEMAWDVYVAIMRLLETTPKYATQKRIFGLLPRSLAAKRKPI